ncbi:segregation and condensation protein B [Lysobacter capsici]|uniref:SMC-Scp complex subunit ScpB n=1 Tax=Lysobacter capsici TaxID=435897 RepID=UPI0007166598|nr:SMC-Scp complex subunit ScpB [Lysobacter capsici]ALN86215.1 segregation and condensation protein B [Lysobacter capsici]
MDQLLVTRIVEASLLAATQPLTLAQLHALFPEDQPAPADSVETALQILREGCADRGVELVELASGFRFQVQADVHPWVARLWTERQTRYTRATLETLALIAYRQPITRGEIEQVRGVAVSSNIIKALEEREWIRVVGHRDVPGKPALFGTTKAFLDYFGLKRLDELPPLSELKDIGELEPQLQFGGEAIAAGGIGNGEDAGNGEQASAEGESQKDEIAAATGDEAADQADASSSESAQADTDADSQAGVDEAEVDEAQAEPATASETSDAPNGADDSSDTAASDTDTDEPVADAPAADEHHPESHDADEPEPADAEDASEHTVLSDDPEAAPGKRAADANDHEQDQHAVETTTVPELEAESEDDQPEQQK